MDYSNLIGVSDSSTLTQYGLAVSADEKAFFCIRRDSDWLLKVSMLTAGDVNSADIDNMQTQTVDNQEGHSLIDLYVNESGTRVFFYSSSNIRECAMSTPFDISTLSLVRVVPFPSEG